MNFQAFAELCERLSSTTKRTLMAEIVADFLKQLGEDEVEPAVSMMLGRAFPKWDPRTLDISWATLSGIVKRLTKTSWRDFSAAFRETGDIGAATQVVFEKNKTRRQATLFENPLTVLEVRRVLEAIAESVGHGSRERKERLAESLLGRATPLEAKYLVKIMIGEMRTGFHEGLMENAVSKAFSVPLKTVQRATMFAGDIGEVAAIGKKQGGECISRLSFKIFRPIKPMLAQTADDPKDALQELGKTAFEYKLDGARIQIHKSLDEVRIFSRRLTDVTESLPEIVGLIRREVKPREAILEGEVIALGKDGNPLPFQHLMRRFKRVYEIDRMAKEIPVRLYLFDAIYVDNQNLIRLPYLERRRKLIEAAGRIPLTEHVVTGDREEAEKFLEEAVNKGHEGVMAKRLDGPYTPGVRGKHWLKIKKTLEPLDLVIVAAEYGYGRRHRWLSDYYLAARDDSSIDGFLIVGKTFKGLTDEEFEEMTASLKEIAIREEGHKVTVLPRIVVEVAYNEIQKSPRYKSSMALRFARITRIRYDKPPEEADTIEKVRGIYEKQFRKKARYS